MTGLPLAGQSVVVTRARAQASGLVDRLADLGATVVELPVIAVEKPPDGGTALAAAADRLVSGAYRWVACTSSNAASRLLAALGDRGVPASTRWAAVGTGTARTLTEGGHPPALVPEVAVSETLAAAFPPPDRRGAGVGDPPNSSVAVLFPRAEAVRGTLAEGLRSRGWSVDEVVAYRTVAGDPGVEARLAAGRADAIAFTSSSTVTRAVELLGADGIPPVVVSIGPITSDTARAAGLEVAAEASPHTLDGLVEALTWALAGRSRPGRAGSGPTHLP